MSDVKTQIKKGQTDAVIEALEIVSNVAYNLRSRPGMQQLSFELRKEVELIKYHVRLGGRPG
jgi:hypothetical protein